MPGGNRVLCGHVRRGGGGGGCACGVTCSLQAVQRAHEQDTLKHRMSWETRLTCPQRVDIAPAKPASTLLPTTLMRELPSAAAASSAGPKWPTRITLTKETSLFNKKPVDTGMDRRMMVYISPLLASQRLRRASMPSTACTLSDRKRLIPDAIYTRRFQQRRARKCKGATMTSTSIARTHFRPDVIARPSGSTVTEGYRTQQTPR